MIKLFYKGDYKRVLVEYKGLEEKYNILNKKYNDKEFKYLEEKCKYEDLYLNLKKAEEEHQKLNGELRKEINVLKVKLRELNGSKGGYTKKIKKLELDLSETKKQLSETENKLKESMTGKFKVRKVRKTKSLSQEMNIKRSAKNSGVIKMVKERL